MINIENTSSQQKYVMNVYMRGIHYFAIHVIILCTYILHLFLVTHFVYLITMANYTHTLTKLDYNYVPYYYVANEPLIN